MSNRYIPYGYKFEAGQPVPHPDESQIVGEIFHRYCAGDSLKVIAEDLTNRQLEYSPGKISWDKAPIKRILENSRYIGSDEYPALIQKEQFVAANLKNERTNTSKLTIADDQMRQKGHPPNRFPVRRAGLLEVFRMRLVGEAVG